MSGTAARVLLVDDDPDLRAGLSASFAASPAVSLVAAFDRAERALEEAERGVAWDVALVDLRLPGLGGCELIARLRRAAPAAEAIALTVAFEDESVFGALRAGAAGYLLKDATVEQILDAIRVVREGGSWMSPAIARRVVSAFRGEPQPAAQGPLSPRQIEVLELLARGATYSMIGRALGISTSTVQAHIRAIYERLEVSTKAEATAEGYRRGLLR